MGSPWGYENPSAMSTHLLPLYIQGPFMKSSHVKKGILAAVFSLGRVRQWLGGTGGSLSVFIVYICSRKEKQLRGG